MTTDSNTAAEIIRAVQALRPDQEITVTLESSLLGDEGVLDSMGLVELCLQLEDKAADLGFEFDWTSATAMSRSRSMFRTIGTLSEEFDSQRGNAD